MTSASFPFLSILPRRATTVRFAQPMNKHEEMVNMVEALVEERLEETVETKVKDAVIAVVNQAVHKMSKTDPGFLSIKETIRREMSAVIQNNIELITKKARLEAELKFAKKVAAARAAIIGKLDPHSTSRKRKFDDLDGLITSIATDAGEDTLGASGDITSILNMAHSINDEDTKVFDKTLADLKDKLPGEAYVRELSSELSAITEREKAIDRLFEGSDDEEMIKDEKVKAIK